MAYRSYAAAIPLLLFALISFGCANNTQIRSAASAMPAPGKEFQDCADCPVMVAIPSGSFAMGQAEGQKYGQADERPVHNVTIAYKFAVGKYEVTKAEYARFVADTERPISNSCETTDAANGIDKGLRKMAKVTDRDWRNPGFPQTDRHPVVCVMIDDAWDYVRWLSAKTGKNYRLLSEAEFEYAARAGSTGYWHWGDDPNLACQYANLADQSGVATYAGWITIPQCSDGYIYTSPVGNFKPNNFGLYDTVGNVQEWLQDCTSPNYMGAPTDGSAWTTGGDCDSRIVRGGIWDCTLTCNIATVPPAQLNNVQPAAVGRTANRDRNVIGYRSSYVGFRVARDE